jgi:hypothetical protein
VVAVSFTRVNLMFLHHHNTTTKLNCAALTPQTSQQINSNNNPLSIPPPTPPNCAAIALASHLTILQCRHCYCSVLTIPTLTHLPSQQSNDSLRGKTTTSATPPLPQHSHHRCSNPTALAVLLPMSQALQRNHHLHKGTLTPVPTKEPTQRIHCLRSPTSAATEVIAISTLPLLP